MSAVIPALDSVTDEQLLAWIKIVTDELVNIEERFYIVDGKLYDGNDNPQEYVNDEQITTPTLQIGETTIEAVKFVD